MKIGTKGHYAVAAMVELAKKNLLNRSVPVPLKILAETQNLSVNYLEQLFGALKKQELVKSIRGAQGGYLLARPSFQITVVDILRAVGESVALNRCKKKSSSPQYCFDQKATCAMHDMWQDLGQVISNYLDQISLEDLSRNNLGQEETDEILGDQYACNSCEKSRNKKFLVGVRGCENRKHIRIS